MPSKKALIFGISGQDGGYLAEFLLNKGYHVHGTSRDAGVHKFENLTALGIRKKVKLHSVQVSDFRSVFQVLTVVHPDEIYNLSGQSSVGLSFEQPLETFESVMVGSQNILEAMRVTGVKSRLYNASSGECFGNIGKRPATEDTAFHPHSPYGVAKAAAFWAVANYRQAYGLHASSGLLFNHESPLRPERFVTRKIVVAAARISGGSRETLRLGDLSIRRDWGWAPDYVPAMWAMLQRKTGDDYVLATGKSFALRDFVEEAFRYFGLDWKKHVSVDRKLFRPDEIRESRGNPAKAIRTLRWKPSVSMPEVVRRMCKAESERPAA